MRGESRTEASQAERLLRDCVIPRASRQLGLSPTKFVPRNKIVCRLLAERSVPTDRLEGGLDERNYLFGGPSCCDHGGPVVLWLALKPAKDCVHARA